MRKFLVAAVVIVAFAAGRADAGGHGDPLTVRTATIDSRCGDIVPAVTRLQPVIGSLQKKGHFAHPVTHQSRYKATYYNPLLGSFTTRKVWR